MRNLKKVLSLVLALIMTMSLATVALAATDETAAETTATSLSFTDASEVENQAEVGLLAALGVLKGYEDGSYQPAKTVSRAEAAKIICYLLLGTDVADTLAEANVTTGFTDVDGQGYGWASGFIQYCASVGIIDGYGDGRYGPNNPVTTYELAKMLLCALGYGANDEYIGSSWATAVAVDAIKNGIIPKGTINVDCTRDTTALFAYTTLFVNQVTYSTDKGVYSTKDADGNTIGKMAETSFLLGEAEGTLIYHAETSTTDAYYDITDGSVTVEVEGALADIGRNVSVWYQNVGTTASPDYVALTAYATQDKVIATVTDGTYLNNGETTAQYTVSGSTAYYLNGAASTASAVATAVAKKGVSVELISTDSTDKTIETVRVTAKTVAVVTGTAKTKTVDGETVVYVPTYTSALGTASSYVSAVGYEGLEQGDVVLLETRADGVIAITVADSFDGNITASGTTSGQKYITVGGTKYTASALSGALSSVNSLNTVDFTGTITPSTTVYTFYKDEAGYIIGAVVADETASATSYVLITDIAYIAGTTTGLNTTADSVQAKVLYTDGTTATITLSTIDGFTPVLVGSTIAASYAAGSDVSVTTAGAAGTKYYSDTATNGQNSTNATLISVADTTAGNSVLSDLWYSYVKNSSTGKYALTTEASVAAVDGTTAENGYYITSGVAKFDGVNIANSKTVFLVETAVDGAAVYTAYTGIANLPAVKSTQTVSGTAIVSNGLSTYVYINAGTVVGAENVTERVFVTDTGYSTVLVGSTVYRVYNVIVNGEKTTLTVDSSITLTGGSMYDLTIEDSIVTAQTATATSVYTGVNSVAGGVIVVAGTTGFIYDSNTAVYVISNDGTDYDVNTVAASGIDVDFNDLVYVASENGTLADTIVVVKQYVDNTLSALTCGTAAAGTGTSLSVSSTSISATVTAADLLANGFGIVATATDAANTTMADASGNAITNATAYQLIAAGTTATAGTTYTFKVVVSPVSGETDVTDITYTLTVTVTA